MRKGKMAAVSTEVAIGLAVAVVALFVALGIFGDNLSSIIANSSIGNLFNGNDSKTDYTSYDRDYSGSQIEVQVMGEQGLEMLRRRANNKAIEIIEENFTKSNPDANSIAYLATAIKAITGQTHICKYMKKDSDDHCDKLGGYDYKIGVSGSALTINKVDDAGTNVSKTVGLKLTDVVATVLATATVPVNSYENSTFTTAEKYSFIKNLSDKLASYIRSDALLLKSINGYAPTGAGKNDKTQPTTSSGELTAEENAQMVGVMNTMLEKLIDSMDEAYDECKSLLDGCHYENPRVVKDDYNKIKTWSTALQKNLNNAISNKQDTQAIIKLFTADLLQPADKENSILDYITDDDDANPTSCKVLSSGINGINSKYGVKITIPECIAGDW